MSERPTDQPTTDVSWAEGPSPHQVVEPTGKRTQGWYEGTGNDDADLHPAGYENWLDREHGRHIDHLESITPRQWTTLAEGIAASTYPDRFVLVPPDAGMLVPWVQQWGGIGQGGSTTTIIDMAADGEYLYYVQNSTLYAETPEDGLPLAGFTGPATGTCATDGLYVYNNNVGGTYGDIRNRATGAVIGSLAYPGTAKIWNEIAANGFHACAVYNDDAENIHLTIWSNVGATPVHVADKSHGITGGQNVYAVCMDHELCFIGGVQGDSSVDVRAFFLSTGAQSWAMSTAAAAVIVRSLATDGELVYVACDQATINGAPTNCFALSRQTGAIVWQYNALFAPAQFNASRVRVDDRFVYISGGAAPNEHTLVMLKHLPGAIQEDIGGALAGAADGASLFVFGNIDTRYRRLRGGASREFMRGDPTDPARRPLHNLAVPIQGG
jgi:hypothetical protein